VASTTSFDEYESSMGGYYNNIMKYNPFLCLYQLTAVVSKEIVVKCLVGKAKQLNLKVVVLVIEYRTQGPI
jgi:hypothetical protein